MKVGELLNEIYDFHQKYSNEAYFKDFEDVYQRWIGNVKENKEKKILNELLINMTFISKAEFKKYLKEYFVLNKDKFKGYEDVIISPMTSPNGERNSAYDVINYLSEVEKEMDRKGTPMFPSKKTISGGFEFSEYKHIGTCIILDDICGTGKTLEKFIHKHKENMKNKKIIILFCVMTTNALKEITRIKEKNKDIDLTVDFFRIEKKISENRYLNNTEYNLLEKIESSLWGKRSNYILGYKKSELLVGFTHNIPNNTLSSIWYHDDLGKMKGWSPLFPRYTKKTKRNRKEENYDNSRKKSSAKK